MAKKRNMKLVEMGRTGLTRFGGYISEEWLPELQGRRALRSTRGWPTAMPSLADTFLPSRRSPNRSPGSPFPPTAARRPSRMPGSWRAASTTCPRPGPPPWMRSFPCSPSAGATSRRSSRSAAARARRIPLPQPVQRWPDRLGQMGTPSPGEPERMDL